MHTKNTRLLIGTNDGVYRAPADDINDVERVLESKLVLRVRRFGSDIFAATRSGLFRSRDAGETWTALDIPRREVYSVLVSPDAERLYAGTHPAHLYVSSDGGTSWRELEDFQNLPSRGTWHTPRHRNEAHVRSLGTHPDTPQRVVAGVEVGGIHVSDDRGNTWGERRDGLQTERRDDLQYDVHHVLVVSGDEYVVSCGGGLYRTRDAGVSWTRLDDGDHTYFREAFVHNGRLYAAATRGPTTSGMDATLFESRDGGDSLESVPYPGSGDEFVLAWAALGNNNDANVLAGTHSGRVLRRKDGQWTDAGSVPARIHSLAVADAVTR